MSKALTVAELIEKLKEMPQSARVVTLGYEGGYDDAEMIALIQIAVGEPYGGVYGAHARPADPEGTGCPIEDAVLIGDPAEDRRGPP